MLRILYHDDALVVCEKPAGVSAQDTADGNGLPSLAAAAVGAEETFPVHRLDAAVGGLTVLAKTRPAAAALSAQLRTADFRKEYLCAVHGAPPEKAGELEDLLFHDRRNNKTYVVRRERKGVKAARLAYETLAEGECGGLPCALLRVRLYTGRTHQIRVQFASRRLPLLGDGKYGARDAFSAPALFCSGLSFLHPVTGERLSFALSPPDVPPWTAFDGAAADR